jgi:protein-S-isoprenylcysteine O-methyltransferase Ste14
MDYLWLVLGWIIYFVIHSVFAIRQIKSYALSLGLDAQRYRLIYNLVALFALIPIFFISINIKATYALEPNKVLTFSGLIFAAYGVILAKRAFKSYDTKSFLGLGPMNSEEELRTDGFLKYVRHPVYSASILILIGYFLFDPKWNSFISVSMLIIYFVIGSYFEERKLIRQFGERYIEYRKKTPMFVPRFRKNS